MEKVIQMYLRNEFATITEYNLQAGIVAEKYHFLVVADFPSDAVISITVFVLLRRARSRPRMSIPTTRNGLWAKL